MLCEALQQEDECFDFACRSASGCFDGRFVLEEEIFWVGVPIELWENGGVEAWWPRELFEFYGERCGKVLQQTKLLRTKLMWHPVIAFLFVRVLFFNESGLLPKPLGLRRLLHRSGVLTKGPHHCQTISKGLPHGLAAKFFFF